MKRQRGGSVLCHETVAAPEETTRTNAMGEQRTPGLGSVPTDRGHSSARGRKSLNYATRGSESEKTEEKVFLHLREKQTSLTKDLGKKAAGKGRAGGALCA